MTVAEWLREREPPPPLGDRVRAALAADLDRDAAQTADVCLTAAETLLRGFLRDGCVGRARAAELLTVDALVTYAFEAAGESDAPAAAARRAQEAMARFCALVPGGWR